MTLVDNLNKKLEKTGRKIVLADRVPGFEPNNPEIVGYFMGTPLKINIDNKEKEFGKKVIFRDFPVSKDSRVIEDKYPLDWTDDEMLYEAWTPSLSKYGFKSNLKMLTTMEYFVKDVNDSMEFDFEAAAKKLEDVVTPEQISNWIKNANYKPTGNETQKGICTDAGEQIREILKEFENIKAQYHTLDLSTEDMTRTHDTTFVYDPKTLEWALLNSKSPYLEFNVFPKEEITKYVPTLKEYFEVDA